MQTMSAAPVKQINDVSMSIRFARIKSFSQLLKPRVIVILCAYHRLSYYVRQTDRDFVVDQRRREFSRLRFDRQLVRFRHENRQTRHARLRVLDGGSRGRHRSHRRRGQDVRSGQRRRPHGDLQQKG